MTPNDLKPITTKCRTDVTEVVAEAAAGLLPMRTFKVSLARFVADQNYAARIENKAGRKPFLHPDAYLTLEAPGLEEAKTLATRICGDSRAWLSIYNADTDLSVVFPLNVKFHDRKRGSLGTWVWEG